MEMRELMTEIAKLFNQHRQPGQYLMCVLAEEGNEEVAQTAVTHHVIGPAGLASLLLTFLHESVTIARGFGEPKVVRDVEAILEFAQRIIYEGEIPAQGVVEERERFQVLGGDTVPKKRDMH